MKFKEYDDNVLTVKRINGNGYIKTTIPMSKRTLNNLPRYSDKKARVHFKDWMGIKGEKTKEHHTVNSIGKAEADGKWYGWSHRAIAGFGVGDTVKANTCGNTQGEYIIKTDDQAKQTAINFANDVS